MVERLKRIAEMEERLNRIKEWLKDETLDSVEDDVRVLDSYYRSPLWRADFEADEAGKLPPDMPRGVLSEDDVYCTLAEHPGWKLWSNARIWTRLSFRSAAEA